MPVSLRSRVARGWCAVVALLYGPACATPAIDFGPQEGGPVGLHGVLHGDAALTTGWLNLVVVGSPESTMAQKVTALTWLANPIGFVSLVLLACRAPILAAVAGAVATGLCAWYLAFPFGRPLIGAYLWAASAGLLVLGAAAVWLVGRRVGPPRALQQTGAAGRSFELFRQASGHGC